VSALGFCCLLGMHGGVTREGFTAVMAPAQNLFVVRKYHQHFLASLCRAHSSSCSGLLKEHASHLVPIRQPASCMHMRRCLRSGGWMPTSLQAERVCASASARRRGLGRVPQAGCKVLQQFGYGIHRLGAQFGFSLMTVCTCWVRSLASV